MEPTNPSKWLAEAFGTFWLVFGGCGSAIFAAKFLSNDRGEHVQIGGTQLGIGFLGVALAFGLTVVTMAYAVGHISGGHFNPAVTFGAAVSGRFAWKDVPGYWISQVVGGLIAGTALYFLNQDPTGNMAANGYGEHSPGGYGLGAVITAEIILTAFFVIIILGATDDRAPQGFAPIAIGLTLTLIHLISIPVTNTSVNPARSTGVAFFNQNGAPAQLWVFWLAPLVGGALGAVAYKYFWDKGNVFDKAVAQAEQAG